MIQINQAKDRHFSDFGWLQTHWLFSFANYYDPQNIQFGALRVYNDDTVQPRKGFPTHPHDEMEIVTIVLSGEITHQDSMGNKIVIRAGDVQRMSAGTGLTHSEFNLGKDPVHFHQIWIYPDLVGLKPSYDQKTYASSAWKNRLLPVASGQGLHGAVTFHTYATIYRSELEQEKDITFGTRDTRRIFIYVSSGSLGVNGYPLQQGDQARMDLETALSLKGLTDTAFILIDVPSCKGWGYDEGVLRGAPA